MPLLTGRIVLSNKKKKFEKIFSKYSFSKKKSYLADPVVSIILVISLFGVFSEVFPVCKLDYVYVLLFVLKEILCSDGFGTEKLVVSDDVLPYIVNIIWY